MVAKGPSGAVTGVHDVDCGVCIGPARRATCKTRGQSSSEHTNRLSAFLTCPVQQPPAGKIQNNRTEEQQVFSIFEGAECERLLF